MSDASIIRTILARECDTVNEYEILAAQAEDPRIRSLVLHLAEEEKEHIAECALLLARIDAEYARYLDKSLDHIDEMWNEQEGSAEHAPTAPAHAAPQTTTAAPGPAPVMPSGTQITNDPYARTIGSLFRADTKR